MNTRFSRTIGIAAVPLCLLTLLGCGGSSSSASGTDNGDNGATGVETRVVTQADRSRAIVLTWPASTEFTAPAYRVIEYHIRRLPSDATIPALVGYLPPVIGTTAGDRTFIDASAARSVTYSYPDTPDLLNRTASKITQATESTDSLASGKSYNYTITALVQQSPTGLYREVPIGTSPASTTY